MTNEVIFEKHEWSDFGREYDHPYNFHRWLFSRRMKVYEAWHTMLVVDRVNGKHYRPFNEIYPEGLNF